jgi:hypothetical protein
MIFLSHIKQPGKVALAKNKCEYIFRLLNIATYTDARLQLTITLSTGEVEKLSAYPDDNGDVSFELGTYMSATDNYAFTSPLSALGATAHPELIGMYSISWILIGVPYGEYDVTSCFGSLDDLYYIQGVISEDDEAYLADAGTDWWTFFSDNQLFLNMLPRDIPKMVHTTQQERLYWIALRTATESLQIHWKATDGTTGIIYKAMAMTEYNAYEINVSPALVQAYLGSRTLLSYMVDIDGYLGEQNYQVDYNGYRNNTFFLFQNSYGVWETFWAKGQLITSHKQLKTTVKLADDGVRNPLRHQTRQIQSSIDRYGKVNTGLLLGNDWALWADDILSSLLAYILIDDRYYPIVINTDESVVVQRPAFEFLNFDNEYYSRTIAI